MPESSLPTLKRKRSVEEDRPEMFHSPIEHKRLTLEDEFHSLIEEARGGFLMCWVWVVLALISGVAAAASSPVFWIGAVACGALSVSAFYQAVWTEVRGSYEAGVIVLLKAIEGRPATNREAPLTSQALAMGQSGELDAARQQRVERVRQSTNSHD